MVRIVPLMRGRQWSLDFPAKRRGWIARKTRNINPFVMQCNLKQKTKPYHLTHFFLFMVRLLSKRQKTSPCSRLWDERSRDYRVLFGRAVMHLLLLACQTWAKPFNVLVPPSQTRLSSGNIKGIFKPPDMQINLLRYQRHWLKPILKTSEHHSPRSRKVLIFIFKKTD